MRRLVEPLIVVDTEGVANRNPAGGAGAGYLRREEAGRNRGRDEIRTEAMGLWNFGTDCKTRNLRVVPVDGEGDGCVTQHAEVEGVVRVLPDVLAAHHGMFSEGLLHAGVELIAEAGLQIC